MSQYVLSFEEISVKDIPRCGGKGAHLGELTQAGIRVPPGYCILADALPHLTKANGLDDPIADIAASLNFDDYQDVETKTAKIRSLITEAITPDDLRQEIVGHYQPLVSGNNKFVAVRSSVGVRETAISSFPGMMDTYHYVLGEAEVLEKVKECWASLWTTRAAYARHQQNIAHHLGYIAPVVQLMVDPDTAGVLFTAHPVTKNSDEMVIESNWGLGESVVSGKSINDFFVLDKETLAVKQEQIGRKTVMFTMDAEKGSGRKEQRVPSYKADLQTLSPDQLVELGQIGKKIEQHFDYRADIEWAYQDGTLYILQTRKIRGLES
jgi:pyruvate,water dikinase